MLFRNRHVPIYCLDSCWSGSNMVIVEAQKIINWQWTATVNAQKFHKKPINKSKQRLVLEVWVILVFDKVAQLRQSTWMRLTPKLFYKCTFNEYFRNIYILNCSGSCFRYPISSEWLKSDAYQNSCHTFCF